MNHVSLLRLIAFISVVSGELDRCNITTSISCTIGDRDGLTCEGNIERAHANDCRDVSLFFEYEVCKHDDSEYVFNQTSTWAKLQGQEIVIDDTPLINRCRSKTERATINTCNNGAASGFQVEGGIPGISWCRDYTFLRIYDVGCPCFDRNDMNAAVDSITRDGGKYLSMNSCTPSDDGSAMRLISGNPFRFPTNSFTANDSMCVAIHQVVNIKPIQVEECQGLIQNACNSLDSLNFETMVCPCLDAHNMRTMVRNIQYHNYTLHVGSCIRDVPDITLFYNSGVEGYQVNTGVDSMKCEVHTATGVDSFNFDSPNQASYCRSIMEDACDVIQG